MIKPSIKITLVAALTFLVSLGAQAQTTFKIATIVPEGTEWMKSMRAGIKTIEERTEGRVSFKIYASGVQGTDQQVRRKMRINQLHGGVFTSGSMRVFQRDQDIYALPMLFRDYDEVKFVREQLDQKIYDRLEDSGFVTFGFAGGGFAYLTSREPISSRENMKGMKIWIPEGDEIARMASKALGISPVSLPLTDVLTGLQTDLIDTVMGPPVGVIVMQWHTAIANMTNLPVAYVYAGLILDGKAFGRISEADQAVVREIMSGIYQQFDEAGITDDKASFDALLEAGINLVEPGEGEEEGWQEAMQKSNQQSADSGVMDGALLVEIQCLLEAYRSQATGANCVE